MKKLLFIYFLFSGIPAFSQDYVYSFSGNFNEENLNKICASVSTVKDVKKCTYHFKPESRTGELIIFVEAPFLRSENSSEFSPATIKQLLIENGLEPLIFNQLKK